jgi:hypothetical protein
MILLFYPVVKSAWFNLYYITKALSRTMEKRIYDQANQTDTFIIKYVSDIILSQSQKKK